MVVLPIGWNKNARKMYKTLKTLVQIVQNYCFSLLNMQTYYVPVDLVAVVG